MQRSAVQQHSVPVKGCKVVNQSRHQIGKLMSWKCCQRQMPAAMAVCSVIDESGNLGKLTSGKCCQRQRPAAIAVCSID